MPLHLEEHVGAATVTGSDLPANPPQAVEWRFDQPQPDWRVTPLWNPPFGAATLARSGEGLRVTLTDRTRTPFGLAGVLHVVVPEWDRRDWGEVVIRARADSASSVNRVGLGFNVREGRGTGANFQPPFQFRGQGSPIVRDGAIHTYRLRVGQGASAFQGPWRELLLWFVSDGAPGSIDILSVSVVPTAAAYADSAHGVRAVTVGERIRRALYVHTAARLSYRVRVPEGGRLDAGLGVLADRDSVTFRVSARTGGADEMLFEERYADPTQWGQRSVDLAQYAGRTVTLTLEAEAGPPGTVAFWGAPTVSGARRSDKPNVIFYIIDGGGADQMSVYGYNRRTTPNLERLAREGVVFEHAYSTALWTGPSTATFLTSLHNSVLGNTADFRSTAPDAPMMAERFHDAAYQTAVFTSNPMAGHARGVDVYRDAGIDPPFSSSVALHREFWAWRETAPAGPYWVHFQTTDVHRPHVPQAPFAGLFALPNGRAQLARWDSLITQWESRVRRTRSQSEPLLWAERFRETGIDRRAYYDLWRSLFDESMAHQDYQLGRFVERLKERGEWENTLLVIAADHSINRGSRDFILPLLDSMPPEWSTEWATNGPFQNPIFRSTNSHVPLIFIWPGRIEGGRRLREPVSMIDVFPTLLDLTGLPPLDVQQGQSLAPLLLGEPGWRARPVVFEEVRTYDGQPRGMIEMLDGRWGASLWIGTPQDSAYHRPTPVVLYDVWSDPLALRVVNDEHPELVRRYTELLQRQWEAHQLLARRFTSGGTVTLTPAQLETLRALGYIR